MTKPTNNSLEHRKKKLLLIAEEVFAQHSFAGASIRLITRKSGMSPAMISYYFGSKEALYLEIFKHRLDDITEEIKRFELLDLNPSKKLHAYLIAYIGRVVCNQNFNRLLRNELISLQHPDIIIELSAARNRLYHFLLNIIAGGTNKGYFKKVDQEIFVLNVLALIRSVFTDHLNTGVYLNNSSQEDLTRRIVDYLMSGLTIEHQYPTKTKNYV